MERIYNILNHPAVYRLSQIVLAPGADWMKKRLVNRLVRSLTVGDQLLDIGCGPASKLWLAGLKPVGFDLNPAYVEAFKQIGEPCHQGSSDNLPFDDHTFDSVWRFGLLHHLTDEQARQTVREMQRVCRPGGVVIVSDAVLPIKRWRRPLAYAIRRLDRGAFMRDEAVFHTLMPPEELWGKERMTYALTGLESLVCVRHMPERSSMSDDNQS